MELYNMACNGTIGNVTVWYDLVYMGGLIWRDLV